MILRGWEIEGFGVFRATALSDIPGGLTVLLGPNEAGKSTLLAFLRFMLFGFPRGQQHRYPPLQGGRHGGRLTFEDLEGIWTLERIQGQPVRLFAPDGRQLGEEALRGRLGGLDPDTFKSVFAFSLFELTDIETLDREEVRERLYSAGITGAGRSAASVLAQLRKGLDLYLRARSKEGVINKLSEALGAARRQLADATALTGRYELMDGQLAAAEQSAAQLAAQAARLDRRRRHLERLEALYVPWNRMRRLELELAEGQGPQAIERGLVQRVEDGRAAMAEAEDAARRQEAHCRDLDDRIAREQSLLDADLLAAAQPLQAVLQEVALQRGRMQRSARLERDIAVARAHLEQIASELGLGPEAELPSIAQGQLRAIDEAARVLQEHLQVQSRREAEAEAARRRLAEAEGSLRAATAQAEGYDGVLNLEAYHARDAALERHRSAIESLARRQGQLLTPGVVAAAVAAAGLGAVAVQDWPLAVLAPLGLLALLWLLLGSPGREMRRAGEEVRLSAGNLGLSAALTADGAGRALAALHADLGRVTAATGTRDRLRGAGEERSAAERLTAECAMALEEAAGRAEAAQAELDRVKASIGVPREILPQHLSSYLGGMQALRQAQAELASLVAERAAEEAEIAAWQARAEAVCRQLGREPSGSREELAALVSAFAEPLQAALKRETALRLLHEEQDAARARLGERRTAAASAATALADALGEAGVQDLEGFDGWLEASRVYEQRLHDRDLAVAAFRDQVGREDETLSIELASGDPELWQAERAAIEQNLEEIRQQRDAAVRESQDLLRLRAEIAESSDVPTLAARCAELEEELGRAGEAWRAQALAQRLLERTLDAYQASRQPDVLRVASDAFLDITAGRYREVRQRGDGQGLLVLTRSGAPKEPDELSRGTREQLYLALRLGLAASFGDRVAALPLVLDDIAVNFDPERQAAFLEVLARFAAERGRQALFFTCHPSLAQAARQAAPGLRVLDMTPERPQAEVAAGAEESLRQQVVRLLDKGALPAKEIAGLAGAAEGDVRSVLEELIAAGRAEAIGRGRGRRYRLA